MNRPQTWKGVRDELEARRTALNVEIAAYPAPITACDAQFNHLLETRREIGVELGRLDAAMTAARTDDALSEFLQGSPFFVGSETGT